MNAKRKSMLAGGLGVLAGTVWVPQFLSGAGAEPGFKPELPAEAAPEARGAQPASPARASAPADGEAEPPDAGDEPVTGAPLARLSSLETRLEALLQRDSGADLAGLLGQLEPEDRRTPGESLGPALEASTDGSVARAHLAEFAERNALTGLIHGGDRSVALLGHRVVREGDVLPGGKVRVGTIGAGWIELACAGESLVVPLPAFRAHGSPSVPSAPSSLSAPEIPPQTGSAPSAAAPSEKEPKP